MDELSNQVTFIPPIVSIEQEAGGGTDHAEDGDNPTMQTDGGGDEQKHDDGSMPDDHVADDNAGDDGGDNNDDGGGGEPQSTIEIAKSFLANDYGITIDEEVENTPDGLNMLFKKMYEKAKEDGAQDVLKKHERLEHLYRYLEAGGDIEKYSMVMYPEVDFTKMEINPESDNPEDHNLMNYIISVDLRMQGYDDEQIAELIDSYDRAGIKGKIADVSLKKLSQIQKSERENLLKEQEEYYNNILQQYEEYKKAYKQRLTKAKDIGNIPISEKDKEDFFNFKFSATKDSTIKEIPYLQEVLYHALNAESSKYNEPKFSTLRDAIEIFVYHYMKDPQFINKLAENRAKTLKAKQQLPGLTPVDRMKQSATSTGSINQQDAIPLY